MNLIIILIIVLLLAGGLGGYNAGWHQGYPQYYWGGGSILFVVLGIVCVLALVGRL